MPSIAELLTTRVNERPTAPFVVDALTGHEHSFGEIYERALCWAGFYQAHGLDTGERIAVVLTNSVDFAELYLGAALAGVTICPYNPALTDVQIKALLRQHGASMLLTSTARARSLDVVDSPVFTVGAQGVALAPIMGLAAAHPRKAELVKLRYFVGLTVEEAAALLEISAATAERDWAFARAWLHRHISENK
jgi:acyl-CoA synthetase (AMP-forming)/AMP-acid ligase II